MYDLNKRSYFTTLGELRSLLADLPDDTEISGAGADGAWLHFGKERNIVCIDPESLSESVEEYYTDDEEQKMEEQIKAHEYRSNGIEDDWQAFFAGNKLMRTFLADDGSWDYELYDIRLTPVDSGQIGEARNMTREKVTREILSRNHLENKERNYFAPTEDFVELCES